MKEAYSYVTEKAIFKAMGITVEVSMGKPGDVIIDITGIPSEVIREAIIREVNKPEFRPLTDNVIFNFK